MKILDRVPENLNKAFELAEVFEYNKQYEERFPRRSILDDDDICLDRSFEAQNGKSSCDRVAVQIEKEGGFLASSESSKADEASIQKGDNPERFWTAYLTKKDSNEEEIDDKKAAKEPKAPKRRKTQDKNEEDEDGDEEMMFNEDDEEDYGDLSDEDKENIDDFGRERDDVIHDIIRESFNELFNENDDPI
ncbi:hypothetical protein PRIPAC_89925 [Pristionchus pacificus]|nr:hypothetical protein PRIPAC_89925 [Pristionchus pacificus]